MAIHPWVGVMSTSLGWEGNRRSGVALAMRHRQQWFISFIDKSKKSDYCNSKSPPVKQLFAEADTSLFKPQPLQRISASWYRPVHHLGLCALPMHARRSSHTHWTGPSRFFCCCSIHLELSTCWHSTVRKHSHFQTPLENPSIQTHLVLLCCIKRVWHSFTFDVCSVCHVKCCVRRHWASVLDQCFGEVTKLHTVFAVFRKK